MTLLTFDVELGLRFGPIGFRSSYANLIKELGRPDSKERTIDGLDRVEYYDFATEFYFGGDQLLIATSRHPGVLLFGKRIVGARLENVLGWFRENGFETSGDCLFGSIYSIEEAGCVFELERTIVTSGSFCLGKNYQNGP